MSLPGCKILLLSFATIWMFSSHTTEKAMDGGTCGYRSVHSRFRIVGGNNSQRGMWPWQVGLYRRIGRDVPEFFCGGALISRRWVLTAAHCFFNSGTFYGNASMYLIKVGDHNLSTNETSQQEVVPKTIFAHHEFSHSFFVDGDIALVILGKKIKLNTFVRPVCLPEEDEGDLAVPGTNGIVAGWGGTRAMRLGGTVDPSDRSNVLRHAAFTIQSDHLCLNKSILAYNTTMTFCAGDGKGERDTCKGDSGGGFVRHIRRDRKSQWVAVGIVSWGKGCAQKDEYGYYTRVYPFIHWIKKTIKESCGKGLRGEITGDCVDIDECYKRNGGCSHGCVNTHGSYHCTCPKGFQLYGERTCRDIDECASNNGGCEQKCKNSPGSYSCSCQQGYDQSCSDPRKCKARHTSTSIVQNLRQCGSNPLKLVESCFNADRWDLRCKYADGSMITCDLQRPRMDWQCRKFNRRLDYPCCCEYVCP